MFLLTYKIRDNVGFAFSKITNKPEKNKKLMYPLSNKYTHTHTKSMCRPCGGKQGSGKQLSANPSNEGTPVNARGKKKWMERRMYGES